MKKRYDTECGLVLVRCTKNAQICILPEGAAIFVADLAELSGLNKCPSEKRSETLSQFFPPIDDHPTWDYL